MNLHQKTIAELHQLVVKKEVSAREIAASVLEQVDRTNPLLNSFISVSREMTLRQAEKVDQFLSGKPERVPLLAGIPIGIKDVINVEGEPCCCGSKILKGYTSPYDATVISRLKDEKAVVFGRLNMDEFAMGSSTENSAYGVTRNPWDLERIPGGSSGGSAAAVAADQAIATLGSDTGGSIRQPASLCGVVGLKPTYGRVSRYGLVAFASSLDQIGPFSKSVDDAAIVLQAISGADPYDSTCLNHPVPDYRKALNGSIKGMKLGLPREYFTEGLQPAVKQSIQDAMQTLSKLGAEIVEISLPHTQYAVATYYIVATAEASANLARFDGVRYGYRAAHARDPLDMHSRTRAEGFGPEVIRRIILGTYVLSSGYYDAYYLRAQKVRTLIRRDFQQAFEKVDAIISPTSPTVAFKAGEKANDPLQMYLSDIFTISTNLAGICGISIPCGFAMENGRRLPIGLQILGNSFAEETILRVAHVFEQSTEFHKQRPQL